MLGGAPKEGEGAPDGEGSAAGPLGVTLGEGAALGTSAGEVVVASPGAPGPVAVGAVLGRFGGSSPRRAKNQRAALTIACLACGTYSLGLGLPIWGLVGIPALSAAFFFAAGGGMFLLWK